MGWHPKHIRESIHSFFWYGANQISSNDAVIEFFSTFHSKSSIFDVLFKVDPIFLNIANIFEAIGISFTLNASNDFEITKFPEFRNPRSDTTYAIVKNIKAKDFFTAHERAEDMLGVVATLHTIFNHKISPSWFRICLVKDTISSKCRQVNETRSSMQKRQDPELTLGLTRLSALVEGFSLEKDSFSKFHRSAQLHSMALASNSRENQILNVWIALESLVPSETKGESSTTIEHTSACLTNFLNIVYIERLLENLAVDLLRWNSSLTRGILKKVKGKKLSDKLARLISLKKYEHLRIDLENATKDFYLLRDRLDYFKSMLETPSSVANALETHKQRLDWQIRRIYRARNIIVHSGRTPRYVRSLIEHAHDYLDTILITLVELASKPKTINSVSQGFKFVELRYTEYFSKLKKKDQQFDDDNIEHMIFGLRSVMHS